MAVRKHLNHTDKVRDRIRVSQLINVVQKHALNYEKPMDFSRFRAIELLLKKSMPDLTAITHSGPNNGPICVTKEDAGL